MSTFLNEFRSLLNEKVVIFKFVTKDGAIHEAVTATTNLRFIPIEHHPKNSGASPKVIPYYDLTKKGWRSMKVEKDFLVLGSRKSIPKPLR